MKYRKLRIAWSVFWGLACVLLIVLWVRSYWWQDELFWRYHTPNAIRVYTTPWHLVIERFPDPQRQVGTTNPSDGSLSYWGEAFRTSSTQITGPASWQSKVYVGSKGDGLGMPFYTPVLAFALLAAVSWIPRQFSLRTLFIAATLIAVALGLILYTNRNW